MGILRIHRETDRQTDVELVIVDLDRLSHHGQQSRSYGGGIARSLPSLAQNREFVAADASEQMLSAQRRLETLGDGAEKGVACGMSMGVIDLLEMVEIEPE